MHKFSAAEGDDDDDDNLDDLFPPHSSARPDGILAVADDLLKNDGKNFIDKMQRLAERRIRGKSTQHPSKTYIL